MFFRLLTAVCLLSLSAQAMAVSQLTITNAWSPQAPPGRMMAGFMQLHNDSEQPVVLVRGESDRFGRVEIHTMRMDEGVMRMRKLDELEIPPGESVELRPGGLHLMLMQPEGRFELGEQFDLDLIDAQDRRWPVTLEIRERRGQR